jgi:hypothetical protein
MTAGEYKMIAVEALLRQIKLDSDDVAGKMNKMIAVDWRHCARYKIG